MEKTLKIERGVYVHNENLDNIPTHLNITLNETDVAWINKMSRLVKRHKLSFIASYYGIHTWPEYTMYDEDDENTLEYDGGTECEKIMVMDGSFFWAGVIRHTDINYESETFSIKDLNKYFKFMDEPLHEMPRYLNDKDEYLQDIAKARMEKGK